jgi:signal transduction histidine kinase
MPGARLGVPLALLLMAVALVLNTLAVYLVVRDHDLASHWLTRPVQAPASVIRTLDREYDLRLISRLIVSAVLIFSAMVILAIQRTLKRVRLVAAEVFARMEKGVIAIDYRGTITVINPAAVRMLMLKGYDAGQTLADISRADLPLAEMVAASGTDPSGCERDFVLERNRQTRRIRADAHILEDSTGGRLGCIIMLRDVTQRYLEEQRLQRIERFQSLGLLASGLIHEIGNPLTALGIHVRLLEKQIEEPDGAASASEIIGVLKSEIERLNRVLEDFRDYADVQTLAVRPTDALGVLEQVARLIQPQAAQQGVRVELKRPGRGLPPVPLDAEKFAQAVLNLAINALDAMPRGGELVLGAALQDHSVEVEVSDNGPGIAPEVRENMFKPYITTKQRGTGLGLALSEKLIVLQRGQIDYHTGPRGTSFLLRFPLAPAGDHTP